MICIYFITGFIIGSVMFSYWIGIALKTDIRTVGDGNPGAFNLWHAAGYKAGILGIFLDFMKGYLPLMLLMKYDLVQGWEIALAAIAPILGHAFSPFVGFKGGKSIAVTFGVWSAVTKFSAAFAFAIILAILKLLVKLLNRGKPSNTQTDGIMVVAGFWITGIYMVYCNYPEHLMLLWLLNSLLLLYTNLSKIHMFIKDILGTLNERYLKL